MATLTKIGQLEVDLDAIRAFAERHQLQELSIFGSALRDDFRHDSDVDVLFQPAAGHEASLDEHLEMLEELKEMFGREVDLVQRSMVTNSFRRHEILTTRRKLYVQPLA